MRKRMILNRKCVVSPVKTVNLTLSRKEIKSFKREIKGLRLYTKISEFTRNALLTMIANHSLLFIYRFIDQQCSSLKVVLLLSLLVWNINTWLLLTIIYQ